MQFDVEGASAAAPFDLGNLQSGLQAAYRATQAPPIVPESAYNSTFGTNYPDNFVSVIATSITFKPSGSNTPITMEFNGKALIEGFETEYGRMNAQLGSTLPNAGPTSGAAIPYSYLDPPTDVILNTPAATPIGSLNDGTQIWRIDHQGVDTHAIHFHLFNVQVINRVGVDGTFVPPDDNELGWKDTVRMNPGQAVIVALRPLFPTLPFKIGDSIRPLNPLIPVGATYTDAAGKDVVNVMTDFGWEYVWHCHLLGHEENDMMRPMVFKVAPSVPSTLGAFGSGSTANPVITVNWSNTSTNPAATMFRLQRSTSSSFPTGASTVEFTLNGASVHQYVDSAVIAGTTYYYRVRSENAIAYSQWSNVGNARPGAGTLLPVTGFGGTSRGRNSLGIVWVNPTTGATASGLTVQTFTGTGPWETRATLAPTTAKFTINGLSSNRSYKIRVIRFNPVATAPSAVITRTTLP
jgi:hypothetical protein